MKIHLNNDLLTLPSGQEEQLSEHFRATIQQQYNQLDPAMRLVAKTAARSILGYLEKKIREKGGNDAAMIARPLKGADPVLHLLEVGQRLFTEMLHHVEVQITTTESGAITAVSLAKDTGEGGRQVDTDGDIRQRKDDGIKVLG